jgi:calcineurin-like phosphoesterase family protein
MALLLTADLHVGEEPRIDTHSFLRLEGTSVMVDRLFKNCRVVMQPEDTLIIVGDVGIRLGDLEKLTRLSLPTWGRRVLVLGDKEYNSRHFTLDEFMSENEVQQVFHDVVRTTTVTIAGVEYFVSHKPTDCLAQPLPAICGHVHGVWRTARMPNGQPIINVGMDAWCGNIVTEDFIAHQYDCVMKGYYDINCHPADWA